MPIVIEIPSALQKYAGNNEEINVEGTTVQEAFDSMLKQFSGLKDHLFDENGKVRSFVNVYVNDEDIRFEQGTETALKDGDNIQIVPSIAGGR